MKLSSGVAKIVFVLTLIVISVSPVACEPSISITVNNQTNRTLKIFFGEAFIGDVVAGGEITFPEPGIFPLYIITAEDIDSNTIYTTNFTRADISGKRAYRVVIPPTVKGATQSDNVTGR